MAVAPLPSEDSHLRRLRVAGTEVNVLGRGRGRGTVVLLHGFGDTLSTWRHVVPALARRRCVVAVDLPGFGASGPIPEGPLLDGRVAAVAGALDELGVDVPVALVVN